MNNSPQKYRAISIKTGKWNYGYAVISHPDMTPAILMKKGKANSADILIDVHQDTICQAIGQTDKYGKEIYCGDKLLISGEEIVTVVWDEQACGFNAEPAITYASWGWHETMADHTRRIEVIGNIIDKNLITK